ncbi:hypothetical protein ACLGIH_32545 [Streptomyces sp. HMX87]|uniref:hypothetical protein n=1 Tax=Streptomyces sp. HMX87 TaxID=3390849 RepID=UPI003A88EE6B
MRPAGPDWVGTRVAHLLDRTRLGLLPDGATLINTPRDSLVDPGRAGALHAGPAVRGPGAGRAAGALRVTAVRGDAAR